MTLLLRLGEVQNRFTSGFDIDGRRARNVRRARIIRERVVVARFVRIGIGVGFGEVSVTLME